MNTTAPRSVRRGRWDSVVRQSQNAPTFPRLRALTPKPQVEQSMPGHFVEGKRAQFFQPQRARGTLVFAVSLALLFVGQVGALLAAPPIESPPFGLGPPTDKPSQEVEAGEHDTRVWVDGDLDQARDFYKKSIQRDKVAFGADNWRVTRFQRELETVELLCALDATDRDLFRDALVMTAECESCLIRGEMAASRRYAQLSCRLIKLLLGENNSLYSNLLGLHASAQEYSGEYAEALKSIDHLTEIRKILYGEGHPQIAVCLARLGRIYTKLGRYDSAKAALDRSLEILRRECGEESSAYGAALQIQGYLQLRRQEFDGARRSLEKSLRIFAIKGSPSQIDLLLCRQHLAQTHIATDDLLSAERLLRQLAPEFAKLADNLVIRAEFLDIYAETLRRLDHADEAGELEAEAVKIRARAALAREPVAKPKQAPTVKLVIGEEQANELRKSYEQLRAAGEFDAARDTMKKWIDVRTTMFGADHWRTRWGRRELEMMESVCALDAADRGLMHDAVKYLNAAGACKEKGEFDREALMARKSCRIIQLLIGNDTCLYADALDLVANAELATADVLFGFASYQELVTLDKDLYGEQGPAVAMALQGQGVALTKLKRYELAESSLRESMKILGRTLGNTSLPYAIATQSLAKVKMEMRQFGRAAQLLDEVITMTEPKECDTSPEVLVVHFTAQLQLARTRMGQKQFDTAESILRDRFPPSDNFPDYVALNVLRIQWLDLHASVMRELNRPIEAAPLETQAAEMRGRLAAMRQPALK